MTGNSLLPTDKQHDAHFAHVCVDCGTPFSKHVPRAGDCEEGDLCQDCLGAREQLTEEHHTMMNRARISQSLPKEYLEALLKAASSHPKTDA